MATEPSRYLDFRLHDRADWPLFIGITADWPRTRHHLGRHAPWFGEVWSAELEAHASLLAVGSCYSPPSCAMGTDGGR